MKNAIIGEISKGPNAGKNFLSGAKIGSVVLYKNWTIGLNGSGFTQLITARTKISQYNIVINASTRRANEIKKFPITNIAFYPFDNSFDRLTAARMACAIISLTLFFSNSFIAASVVPPFDVTR